jgi:hypothetical protein
MIDPLTGLTTAYSVFAGLLKLGPALDVFLRNARNGSVRIRTVKCRLESCLTIIAMLERAQRAEARDHVRGDAHDEFRLRGQLESFLVTCQKLSLILQPFISPDGQLRKRLFFSIRWNWALREVVSFEDELRSHESCLTLKVVSTM